MKLSAVRVGDTIYIFAVDWWNKIWYQKLDLYTGFSGSWIEVPGNGRTKQPVGAMAISGGGGVLGIYATGIEGRIWENVLLAASPDLWTGWRGPVGDLNTSRAPTASTINHVSQALFAAGPTDIPKWYTDLGFYDFSYTTSSPWSYIPPTDVYNRIYTTHQMAATENHNASPNLSLYTVATNDRIYRRTWYYPEWKGKYWSEVGGITDRAPAVTTDYHFEKTAGEEYLFVKGKDDNRIYYRTFNLRTQTWDGWEVIPTGITRDGLAVASFDEYDGLKGGSRHQALLLTIDERHQVVQRSSIAARLRRPDRADAGGLSSPGVRSGRPADRVPPPGHCPIAADARRAARATCIGARFPVPDTWRAAAACSAGL